MTDSRMLLRRSLLFATTLASWGRCQPVTVAKDGINSLSFSLGNIRVENTIFAGSSLDTLRPVDIGNHKRGDVESANGGHTTWSNVADDAVTVHANYPESGTVSASFTFPADDIFYGVWEYPWNGSITNNISQSDIGVYGEQPGINWSNARSPFFFTKSGFGVYVDSEQVGTFDFSQKGKVSFTFNAQTLTYSVLYNQNLTALLTRYAELSSTIQLPPDSGYGPIFWSDDFEQDFHAGVTNAQQNYYDVVDHLYYKQIRATAMFADRPYGTGNMSFGNFDFDPTFYPTPPEFIANLTAYGFDFQVWVANRAFLNTELYNTSKANGWLMPGIDANQFLGPALNLSIPAAYNYFLDKLSYFPKAGVKGYKIDRGEEHEMPDAEQNIQNVLFDEICYKSMAQVWGEGKFYNFARAAFDKSRSKTAVWNGDSQANFTGLRYSVASAIRAGLLGFSQWGSDTGGYLRATDSPTEELWARWMHFSTFSPMYEIVVGTNHTPWYPPYSSRLVNVLKTTADLHTLLIPYIRSYTYQATKTGIPVVRALFLEYPTDDAVYEIADEYSFGKEFLVAPIVSEGGSRTVYFPKGSGRFVEYFNKTQIHSGGDTLNVTGLPLEYAPVYVKEGAIIPNGDVYQGNAKWQQTWRPHLEIELYPSFNVPVSTFEYYRGSGNSTATITVTTDKASGGLTIAYDDLGMDALLLLYTKNGVETIELPNGGKALVVHIDGFTSIFD